MSTFVVEPSKNWLQMYVDAMTEKDPYKRLAMVRQLRAMPRFDESDPSPERARLQLVPKPAPPKPILAPPPPIEKPRVAAQPRMRLLKSRKSKATSKASRRSGRLRSA